MVIFTIFVLQQQYEEELAAESRILSSLEVRPLQLLNAVPIGNLNTIKCFTPGKMHVASAFPCTHFHYTDPNFVKMLGVTTARALALPIAGISMFMLTSTIALF